MARAKTKTKSKAAPRKKRQAVSRSPAASPPPTESEIDPSEQEFLVVKVSALFWATFARGADMPVEPGCFNRAMELGALANVRKHILILKEMGETFLEAEHCSYKAGVEAKKMATNAGVPAITPDIYQAAFEKIAGQIQRVAGRRPAGAVRAEGLLC